MMAALSARRLVCSATSSMTFTIWPMASMREPRLEMTLTASCELLLDAVDLADGLEDGLGALLCVEGDLLGEARGLVGVRLHLIDGHVHLVHRGAGLLGGEREGVDVLGDLLDGEGHLLDGAHRLADAPASSPTFSATSSLVAVISRIEELDSRRST